MSLHIPASKDTLFMRGFNYRQDIDQIREFFASKCGRNTVEFFKEDGKDQLFLALKFESKDVAKDVLERFNETEVLGDRVSMTWYKDLRRARPFNDYRRQPYRGGYGGDTYDHRERGGYQGRSSYQRTGGRYRTASNSSRMRRYSRSVSKSRSGSESGSVSRSRSKSSSCSRDSRDAKKKRRDQSDSGSNRRRTVKKRQLALNASKDSEHLDVQQYDNRNTWGPRSPPPIKNSSDLLDNSDHRSSLSPQRKSKQALQSKIITATLELEQQQHQQQLQQQQQQQQHSADNQSIDMDGDDYGYDTSPRQQMSKQSNRLIKSSVQKKPNSVDSMNSATGNNTLNNNNNNTNNNNTANINKKSAVDPDEKQTSEWIPVTSNAPDNSSNLNNSLTRKQLLQQQLQLVLNREQQLQQQQQQQSQQQQLPTTTAASATTTATTTNSAKQTGDNTSSVSYDIGNYYKKYSNTYKKHEEPADSGHNNGNIINKVDSNVNNSNMVTFQQQQHSKQPPNVRSEVVANSTGVMKDIQNTNDVHEKSRPRQSKDYEDIDNKEDDIDGGVGDHPALANSRLNKQSRKRKYNANRDKFISRDVKTSGRDDDDEDDDDGGAVENDYSDSGKHNYSRYENHNDMDNSISKKQNKQQQRIDDKKQQHRKDYGEGQAMQHADKSNSNANKMSLLGLSHEKMLLIKDKKEEVEKAYRQDCETFATVTKLLISKDPFLEERIQKSLRENLRDIGHRCVQELREFVDRIKNNDVDEDDVIGRVGRDIMDF